MRIVVELWKKTIRMVIRGSMKLLSPEAEIHGSQFYNDVEDAFVDIIARRLGIYLLIGIAVWLVVSCGGFLNTTSEVWGRLLVVAGAIILAWSAIIGPVRVAMVSSNNLGGNEDLARSLIRRAIDGVVGILVLSAGHVLLL